MVSLCIRSLGYQKSLFEVQVLQKSYLTGSFPHVMFNYIATFLLFSYNFRSLDLHGKYFVTKIITLSP